MGAEERDVYPAEVLQDEHQQQEEDEREQGQRHIHPPDAGKAQAAPGGSHGWLTVPADGGRGLVIDAVWGSHEPAPFPEALLGDYVHLPYPRGCRQTRAGAGCSPCPPGTAWGHRNHPAAAA